MAKLRNPWLGGAVYFKVIQPRLVYIYSFINPTDYHNQFRVSGSHGVRRPNRQ